MKQLRKSLQLDISRQYELSILAYEQDIQMQPTNADINIYINLAFLYWHSIAQFAWADHYKIPNYIRDIAYNRYKELLNIAKVKFPDYGELYFWEKYFNHRLIYDDLTEEEILLILHTYKDNNLVPYFFLYLFDENKYKNQRDLLHQQCILLPTAKNNYIKSLLEAKIFLK